MKFNLIPWDSESYLIAADSQEEQGNLLSKAIRDKVLPFDIENGDGKGQCHISIDGYGCGDGSGYIYINLRNMQIGDGIGFAWGWGENRFGVGLGDREITFEFDSLRL